MPEQRLLILGCTTRKRTDTALLPARERYNGPAFQVYRRFHASRDNTDVRLYVLSAEFGLISEHELIPTYDRRMTDIRARQLSSAVYEQLNAVVASEAGIHDVLVCAGRTYVQTLKDPEHVLGCPITCAGGSIGRQIATLRDWLYGAPPPAPTVAKANPVSFRGRVLECDAEDVLRLAQQHTQTDSTGAGRYEAWYVSAGKLRVAPKWLVSVLTGVPVASFRTADARRVLAQLGVEVHRA